mgnify:CR=1 FL=1
MSKSVVLWMGAGQIGMAIARRIGYGRKIVVADKRPENAEAMAKIMTDAGFDCEWMQADLASRASIREFIAKGQSFGGIDYLVNAAGVSPSQASIETILQVDLYGTAVLLEEVGKVIAPGGAGVTISSQSGKRMPQLTVEQDRQLATTPCDELLDLALLQPENVRDTLHAYQLAKRCNEKRVMFELFAGDSVARASTRLARASLSRRLPSMSSTARAATSTRICLRSVRRRPGTADEVGALAELVMGPAGAFVTGSDFLIDGGATASYFYGPLQPDYRNKIRCARKAPW